MNILGIGSHPDDLEIGCGGTLAKYAKQGHKVFMCHIANGNMGHMVIKPDELSKIREKEAENAAKVLGAEAINIDTGDFGVESADKEILRKVVEVVRYTKPDVIITHNPDDYMRDHMEASRIAFDASFRMYSASFRNGIQGICRVSAGFLYGYTCRYRFYTNGIRRYHRRDRAEAGSDRLP